MNIVTNLSKSVKGLINLALGGSACYLYLGAAWFEYWLEDQQT